MTEHSPNCSVIEPASVKLDFERKRIAVVGRHGYGKIRQLMQLNVTVRPLPAQRTHSLIKALVFEYQQRFKKRLRRRNPAGRLHRRQGSMFMGTDTQPLLSQPLNNGKCIIIPTESHTDRHGIDEEPDRLVGMLHG